MLSFHDEFDCRQVNRTIAIETYDWRPPKFSLLSVNITIEKLKFFVISERESYNFLIKP